MVGEKRRVALVSREVAPFGGGGVGRYVSALAGLLGDELELTILTTSRHRAAYERTKREAPDSLPPARVVFVREPRPWDARSSFNVMHAWSAAVHEALIAHYEGHGPDLVEFADFLGEGCVTAQAKLTGSPALSETTVCVRVHGTAEIYDVLDGFMPRDPERSFTHDLERYSLRYADALLWAGGDILDSYRRFYGEHDLATARRVRHPFAWEEEPPPHGEPGAGPLRLLYLGRLERRKGVRDLIETLLGLERREWSLTMVGADTETAPLGQSMRALLEAELAGDRRVTILDAVPRSRVPGLIDEHDALVVPSLWECWPYVALEALARGTPLVATPTGGLPEMVGDGTGGWLAPGTGVDALERALEPLVADPGLARARFDRDACRARFARLTDPAGVREAYHELTERGRREPARPRAAKPLVSIVIPYFEMEEYVAETVGSAAAQTHSPIELIVINDGSFRPEDEILLELERRYDLSLVAQPNSGLGAARNLGIELSRGDYVLPLDADNVVDPGFVSRCVEALEAGPEIAYVTAWLRYIDHRGRPWKGTDEGLRPLGNSCRAVEERNVAGDAVAVIRRSVFDSGLRYSTDVAGFEDWTLYREMRRRGLIGHVIPEPLIGYRLRDDSMMRAVTGPREAWARGAIDAHLRERAIEWTVSR